VFQTKDVLTPSWEGTLAFTRGFREGIKKLGGGTSHGEGRVTEKRGEGGREKGKGDRGER